MNKDKIILHSRDYWDAVRREREERGLDSSFLDPNAAAYDLADLAAQASKRGQIEGPNYLTPAQTAIAQRIFARTDATKEPERKKWIEALLERFGGKTNRSQQAAE